MTLVSKGGTHWAWEPFDRIAFCGQCCVERNHRRTWYNPSMPPLNPFPVAELPHLKNPPIELIIGQVRVPLVPELLESNGITAFYNLAKAEYPHIQKVERVAIRFSHEDNPQSEREGLWKFENSDHSWTITIAPEFVALEARKYQSFAEFRERLVKATEWFVQAYGSTLRVRVGLRYVDRFTKAKYQYLQPGWLATINPHLLGLSNLAPGAEQRSFVEHQFALGQSYGLTFRAAITFMDTASQGEDELTFDVDAFNQEETAIIGVAGVLDVLKVHGHSAFAWAGGDLVKKLETE